MHVSADEPNKTLAASPTQSAEPAVVIDVSEGGLGMILPFPARKGDRMLLDLAGFGLIVRQIPVHVLNVQVISGKLCRIGVAIDWQDHSGQPAYRGIVERISLGEVSKAVW